jgi:type IV pilus assembly protein PilN
VILINLLPHREAARKRRRDNFHAALGAAVLLGLLIAVVAFAGYQSRIADQQASNGYLQAEIGALDAKIQEISSLQAEIAALRSRQQAVEDLQGDRNLPVQLLNELARQLPDGVYLTSLRQDNQRVTLQGSAQSNERVSELLRNLASHSAWLTRPELVEITAASMAMTPHDVRRVANFTARVGIERPADARKAAAPAKPAIPATKG